MRFIRKHSPGPFSVENYGSHSKIIDGEGNVIATGISNSADADGMACFSLMRDYLIERARYLSAGLKLTEGLPKKMIPRSMKKFKKELDNLLTLIKKAGVEVVE